MALILFLLVMLKGIVVAFLVINMQVSFLHKKHYREKYKPEQSFLNAFDAIMSRKSNPAYYESWSKNNTAALMNERANYFMSQKNLMLQQVY